MTTRKIVRRALLAALGLYVAWLAWQVVGFRRYESAAEPAPAGARPEQAVAEIEGVYHLHSRFSDGRKSVAGIAKAAASAGLGFIILTDHGNPNDAALDAQGRYGSVLVLAGAEISSNRGHLVALGFDRPSPAERFSREAEIAAREVASRGGFSVIAHPYSKTRWSWGESSAFDGIEIMDLDTMLRRNVLGLIPFLPALLVRPSLPLLRMVDPPEQTLRKWDELLRVRPVLAFFSADAHFLYRAAFAVFHLHLLLDRPLAADIPAARRQVFDALRAGRFFSAVDAAAAARGFRLEVRDGVLRAATPFSFGHETVIIRDGRTIQRTRGRETILRLAEPGVYRIEVFLRERTPLAADVPWIVSNAIVFGR